MRTCFTVIARIIAGLFAGLFVLTAILAIFLTTIDQKLFDATLYKNTLTDQNIYRRLPEILALAITSSTHSDPCSQNPLACSIDGASPELKSCLTKALGQSVYESIGSGQRKPTAGELQLAQPCLDHYGSGQTATPPAGTGGSGGMPPFFQNLTTADWQGFLTILLPPNDVKTMAESTLDQLFAYLNGGTNTVAVPLEKMKEILAGPGGTELFMQLLDSQPPCTDEDVVKLINSLSNDEMVYCKPPQEILSLVATILPDLLNLVVQQLPDKVILIEPPAPGVPSPGTGPFGSDPITTLRTIRLFMRLSFLVPLAFLLLVTLFAVRSLKSWMRWWGIPFFISGIIALIMGIATLPILNIAWGLLILPRIPPYLPADIVGVGQELLRSIFGSLSIKICLQAVILLVIGLAAWIGSTFVISKDKPGLSALPPTLAS
jgi:hypothetical protein